MSNSSSLIDSSNGEKGSFGKRKEFVKNVVVCWNPANPSRACTCGTFCAPCVYARGFELVHGGYKNASVVNSNWPPEWPRSCLGFSNCFYWPNLAPYEATHDNPDNATSSEFCVYCCIGLMPCVCFQPCQIAGEINSNIQSASNFM